MSTDLLKSNNENLKRMADVGKVSSIPREESDLLQAIKNEDSRLDSHFNQKLEVNPDLDRTLVSFQANKVQRGYRWFKYREGFSEKLIRYTFNRLGITSGKVLDPFAGSGAALFVARDMGMDSVGIELLCIGSEIMKARKALSNGSAHKFQEKLTQWKEERPWTTTKKTKPFPHLRITEGAFPTETEQALGKFLLCLEKESSPSIRRLLRFAALCVLEDISYTRKDGQYLRWDDRSGRHLGAKPFCKGEVKSFERAILQKLDEISFDLGGERTLFNLDFDEKKSGKIEIIEGSCLQVLPKLDSKSFDCIVTSPPYCNRYDYTRTYALELAMLGIDEKGIRDLRQKMVSCTVENRDKPELKSIFGARLYSAASKAFDSQRCLQSILSYLEYQRKEGRLNNPGISRMVRNYFFEMSIVIFECARILKPGAPFIMVNDNVRYAGVKIPVDLILSEIAEKAGFEVERIWVLPIGKGNSSQQMGEHGREELRKCVYIWRRSTKRPAINRDRRPALAP